MIMASESIKQPAIMYIRMISPIIAMGWMGRLPTKSATVPASRHGHKMTEDDSPGYYNHYHSGNLQGILDSCPELFKGQLPSGLRQ